jgi:pyrroloquinoline quinone biosynthesis protein D
MADSLAINSGERFEINPLYMFRWEETQDAFILLYPEGVVKLSETAAEILKRCNGEATVVDIVRDLAQQYAAGGAGTDGRIEDSVRKFLEVSHAKGWIRRKA